MKKIWEWLRSRMGGPEIRMRWRNFLRGMGSVLELWPPPRNYVPGEYVQETIQRDWEAVAKDICAEIQTTASENEGIAARESKRPL